MKCIMRAVVLYIEFIDHSLDSNPELEETIYLKDGSSRNGAGKHI
jgi:hypothetical protein